MKMAPQRGIMIAVLGPDGSGKSSVIAALAAACAPAFAQTVCLHLRPGLLPSADPGTVPVEDPHGKEPYGWLRSALKLAYYVVDYAVGYHWRIRPVLRQAGLVIFDRYYHDLLVDPKRYRYAGPPWLARWAARVIPGPDLFVLLDAPPDVLQRRKREVPFAETRRQCDAYRALIERCPKGRIVDATQPLETVVSEVQHALSACLVARGLPAPGGLRGARSGPHPWAAGDDTGTADG
jgi:thymidylate kinase